MPAPRMTKQFDGLLLSVFVAIHAALLLAGFVAPYPAEQQHRLQPYQPPQWVHLWDGDQGLQLRPFVYPWVEDESEFGRYLQDRTRRVPLSFWVEVEPYRMWGFFPMRHRLVGVEEGETFFWLGTDGLGRDVWSRLLLGGQISLGAGVLAAVLALGLGWTLGLLAGFLGGPLDRMTLSASDLFLALPWLYLLLAVRAALPLDLPALGAFGLVVGLIGVVGWAQPARLVRAQARSLRSSDFVLAARAVGVGPFGLARRHLLPQTLRLARTQASLLLPRFVTAEVGLSFLGLGVAPPIPSWGNLLADLRDVSLLSEYPWLMSPAVALAVLLAAYSTLPSLNGSWLLGPKRGAARTQHSGGGLASPVAEPHRA